MFFGGPFASIGLLEYALVVASNAALARGALLSTNAFHF